MDSTWLTKMWRIKEKPGYEVEQTPGAWVVWGPCCSDEECAKCGGTNSRVEGTCGLNSYGGPTDPDMLSKVLGLERFTPVQIQRPRSMEA